MSTLDVHGWGSPTTEQDVAIDNVRRFAALGGTVVYGTDLGNGPLPVGVNPRELRALAAAGLDARALVAALTRDSAAGSASLATWIPGDPPDDPGDPDALATWLARAVVEHDPTPEGRP